LRSSAKQQYAEVVDRQAHAQAGQAGEAAHRRIVHQHRFDDLDGQLRRLDGVVAHGLLQARQQAVLAQLVGRHVDGRAHAQSLGALGQLPAGLLDHPVAQLPDQAEALGHRDEDAGHDQTRWGGASAPGPPRR
jgi:hypothetical protein